MSLRPWNPRCIVQWIGVVLLITTAATAAPERDEGEREWAPHRPAAPRTVLPAQRLSSRPTRVVNFGELARREAMRAAFHGPPVPLELPEPLEEDVPEPVDAAFTIAPPVVLPPPPPALHVASPSPSANFSGLDDIPMADTTFIIIPPDCDGAVGRTRILQGLNNNYRILDKSGTVLSTVGTNTFWSASGGGAFTFFDPKTLYDPVNDRWIVCMLSDPGAANSSICFGVSQTSDPAGAYNIARVDMDAGNTLWADYPEIGFNKNWIAINVNMFTIAGGVFSVGRMLVIDYPQFRSGTLVSTVFNGTDFCESPCATHSPSDNTLYVADHLVSGSGTYRIDTITGTPSAPVFTTGPTLNRGLTWTQSGGQVLPQAAPLSGTSVCGATPCPLETQDSRVRSTPVARNGFLYYAQTIGLPSGVPFTHTAVQWTKLNLPSGSVADGGRVEDPTANSTNGGKWYAYPHIAANSVGDIMLGFTQFSSSQFPATGYTMHLAADAAGTMRDPVIVKSGDDYYHKTFSGTRNRWGDYAKAQVDPADDRSLWTVNEFAKTRNGTNDGNTGANSSRWGTWWAMVAGPAPTVTLATGPSHAEGNAGATAFTFTVNLSTAYSLPVTVQYQTQDGTATLADNDYVPATSSIVIPAGNPTATITVNVNGDLKNEPNETFSVALTGATNGTIGGASIVSATIVNDDDTVSPTVTVLSPNGGETLTGGQLANLTWNAADNIGVTTIDLLLSRTGAGGPFEMLALDKSNTGSYSWYVTAPFTAQAFLKVVAHDVATNSAQDLSNAAFTILATTAVELSLLEAETVSDGVTLRWQFGDPTDLEATWAERASDPQGTWSRIGGETRAASGVTSVLDHDVESGRSYWYRVVARPWSGQAITFGPIEVMAAVAARGFGLAAIVPNPTTGATRIDYALARESSVRLAVVDVQGRTVATLVDATQAAGRHQASWNGSSAGSVAPSGIYFIRLQAGGKTVVRRLAIER